MKKNSTQLIVFILFGILTACEPKNPYAALQEALHSNLSEATFQSYLELNEEAFENLVEKSIEADCPSKEIGEPLKEIQRVEAARKMRTAGTELSDEELVDLIEGIKSEYTLRKAALCW